MPTKTRAACPYYQARAAYQSDAFGLHTSDLDTGDGNDNVSITALSQGQLSRRKGWYTPRSRRWNRGWNQTFSYDDVGVYQSNIDLGDGDDKLTVTTAQQQVSGRNTYQAGTALESSTVDLGAGDDTFTLTGKIKASTIKGGEGYDVLDLDTNFQLGRSWKSGSQSGFNKFKRALAQNQLLKTIPSIFPSFLVCGEIRMFSSAALKPSRLVVKRSRSVLHLATLNLYSVLMMLWCAVVRRLSKQSRELRHAFQWQGVLQDNFPKTRW